MDFRSRPLTGQEPPGGEYTIAFERPFPHRLDRAFRVGAIVVAAVAAVTTAGLLLASAPRIPEGFAGVASVGLAAAIAAALAYGFTRAIGLIVTSIVGGLRRKAYVVDWEEHPPR